MEWPNESFSEIIEIKYGKSEFLSVINRTYMVVYDINLFLGGARFLSYS